MTTIKDLADLKKRGQKWAMLTSYEMMTAEIFDEAGIPVLLVGDSAGNNFFGEANTIPVTVEELLPLVRAVSRSVKQALVVADLPFGSYESGAEQALATSIRFFKESGAHAVKLRLVHRFTRAPVPTRSREDGPSARVGTVRADVRGSGAFRFAHLCPPYGSRRDQFPPRRAISLARSMSARANSPGR